jgi:tetratricopeptide (TPR) repeat protein
MKHIKLFLAASKDGLDADKASLGAFIDDLNERFEHRGVIFELITDEDCEDEKAALSAAADNDAFHIIFFKDAPELALKEFEAAHGAFKAGQKPRIMTYFKQLHEGERDQGVRDFMDRLDNELGHYFNEYSDIDTIKLNLVLQLEPLGLHANVELHGSTLWVEGREFMPLDKLPIVNKNSQLRALKDKYNALQDELDALRQELENVRGDKEKISEIELERLKVSGRKNKIEDEIKSLEKDIIDLHKGFLEKDSTGNVSAEQKRAKRRLEAGDIEGALDALQFDMIKPRGELALAEMQEHKNELQTCVNDLLMRAKMFKTNVKNPNRFAEIDKAYLAAIRFETEGGLDRDSQYEYATYLLLQNRFRGAIVQAESYLNYYKSASSSESKIACVMNLLAVSYSDTNRHSEAEALYKRALEIRERLAADNPEAYESDLARSCNNLANLYSATNRHSEAEVLYKRALEIYERLAAHNPEAFDRYLARSCNNLA